MRAAECVVPLFMSAPGSLVFAVPPVPTPEVSTGEVEVLRLRQAVSDPETIMRSNSRDSASREPGVAV